MTLPTGISVSITPIVQLLRASQAPGQEAQEENTPFIHRQPPARARSLSRARYLSLSPLGIPRAQGPWLGWARGWSLNPMRKIGEVVKIHLNCPELRRYKENVG